MHLVERMHIAPAKCLYCGCGHAQNEDGSVGPFLDLERDVNWGDATYLCMTCVMKVAAICGYVDRGQLEEKDHVIKLKDQEIHDLKAEYDYRIRRIRAVKVGTKAAKQMKRAKQEAAS